MEKRTRTSSKAKDFFKKNMYYIIMALCLIAVAAMIAVTVIMKNAPDKGKLPPDDTPVITVPDPDPDPVDTDPDPVDTDPDPVDTDPDPVDKPIVFASPVANVNILQDYTSTSLVWYTTLKHYRVHEAIDFGGQEGDKVYAVYDGKVESVDFDVFHGHVVTIRHSDTLVTRYESLDEPIVTVGQSILKGQQIGTMSNSASRELDLGPRLHFSVLENGEEINPYTYLAIGDK